MFHEKYMLRCLELAASAIGYTAPNPMVGAVLTCDERIIGEGFHQKYGEPHAETNAINSVKDKDLLKNSTLYVNLEPCSHHGKTPPCVDLIIESRIPHVVTGCTDPNPLVAGQGIAKLRAAGIKVTENVLKEDCERLNIRFMTFYRQKRPYIILKWAQTADGFIDVARDKDIIGQPTWITGWFEQTLVHKWRAEEQAIMIGTNTAMLDNPLLSVRRWHGHQPTRITLDRHLRLPQTLNLFDGSQPTIVFTEQPISNIQYPISNIQYITVPFDEKLPHHILNELFNLKITSVFIEGGAMLLQTFIDADLWDEARIFTGKKLFRDGVKAPVITNYELRIVDFEYYEEYHHNILHANREI